ncbi:Ig-like domain-containing protein, partial [Bacteroidota bacterium]
SRCDTADVYIEVIPITTANEPPIANADNAQTKVNVAVISNVLVNDGDPDGDNLVLNTTLISGPSSGSVAFIGTAGDYNYTPVTDFTGVVQFIYEVCDDATPSLCDTAVVTVTVLPDFNGPDNDPPFAGDDAALTPQEVPVSGDLVANDTDPNGDNIIINTTAVSGPSNGSLIINANGTYTYTPSTGFTGPDQFVYQICDDGSPSLCAQATAYITVYKDNNPPVAVDDINNTLVDVPVAGNVSVNDSDPDGDNLTVTTTSLVGPSYGALVLNANGTYVYTPGSGYVGEDSFTYVTCDDGIPTLCDTAEVAIEVAPLTDGNEPPIANDDAFVTKIGVTVAGSILTNDDDVDGDNIIINTNPITSPSNGAVTIFADGTMSYVPSVGFVGKDVFTYSICDDGTPTLCDTAEVVIVVLPDYNGPDNDPPFAGDDAAFTPQEVAVSGDLLANDFDPNGDNIVVNTTPISGPYSGSVVINGDGTYTYTPPVGYTGTDQFVYQICDDGTPSLCAQATAYITVYAGPQVTYTIVEPLCHGQSNGSIDVTVTNATSPVTYSWSPGGATTQDISGKPAGTYVVTVTDGSGSVVQKSIDLTEPDALAVNVINVVGESTVGGCDGSATASVSGGTPGYAYLWSDGQTTATATDLCDGIIQITVTDTNGCDVTTSNVIDPPSCDLDVLVTGTHVDCNGGNDGSVTASPITAQNNVPFSYLWNTGDTIATLDTVSAGPYSVEITDGIGCTASGSFTVTEPPLLKVTATAVDEQSFGACDGSATAFPVGGTEPYTYIWSGGQSTATATSLCPGVYTVTIIDDNGCTAKATVTVNEISCAGFTATVNTYDLSCFGTNDGSAVAVVSGGTAPFDYLWSPGLATTDSLSSLSAGTYTVKVTDALNCEQVAGGNVVQPALLEAATAVENVTCHGLANGTIELTVTGGTTPYSFVWSNGSNSEDLDNLGPNTYTVAVTDTNGCTAGASGIVTEKDTLGATSVDVDITCFSGSDGSIDLTPTGGIAPYSFSWSNGQATEDLSGLEAGTYTVTFNDQNSCVFVYQTTLTESPLFVPTISADGPLEFCYGDSVQLTVAVDTAVSYLWSTGETTKSITVFTTDNYSVQVTDTSGCVGNSANATVVVNPLPTPTVNPISATTFCDGDSVTLATGSYASYLWSTGETTQQITVDTAGSYSVTVVNAKGCTGTSSGLAVTVNSNPTPSITVSGPLEFCQGGSVMLTSSFGAGGFQWSTGEITQQITVSTADTFTVTVSSIHGCTGTADSVITVVNPNPVPVITASGPTAFCDGDSVTLTSSVASSYLWNTSDTTQSITVYQAGSYTVSVVDANGCEGTSAVKKTTVFQNPEPTIVADGPLTFCDGDSVVLTSSTGVGGYMWSSGETTRSITVFASGKFAVKVTDGNGCSGVTDTVTVVVNSNPTPTLSTSGPVDFCLGQSVTLTAPIGGAYIWNTGATAQNITVSAAGSYWTKLTDPNGCSSNTDTITVTTYANPTPTISVGGPLEFCDGDSVVLTSSAADGYLWNTGETTQSIVVYNSGSFRVTVTDGNGCSGISAPTTVTVNNLPLAFIFATGPTKFCDGDDVILIASGADSYLWNTGDTTQMITVDAAGTYYVTITDDNGCQSVSNSISVQLYTNPTPTLSAGGPVEFCAGGSVELTVSASSYYVWSTGQSSQSITVGSAGPYWATVTDSLGCSGISDSINVTINPNPVPTISADGPLEFCDGDSVVLTSSAAVSYTWNTGDTTQSIVVHDAGGYYVSV